MPLLHRLASALMFRAGGNVAILVGLVLLPIVIFAGMATDRAAESPSAAVGAAAIAQ